jgi:hypothetical protein
VVSAATSTLAGTATTKTTFTGARLFGPSQGTIHARGEFDFASGRGYEAIPLDGRDGRPQRTDYLLFLPNAFYIQPSNGSGLPAGRCCARAALVGSASAERRLPGFVGQAEAMNPELPLSELAWGAVSASAGTSEVVAHVPYLRYDVTVSLTRAHSTATRRSPAIGAAISDELGALRTAGISGDTLRIRVWVDGPGHVVRLRATLPGSTLGTATTILAGFGVKVPSTLPASSQVVDLTTLGGSPWLLGASSGG